MDTLPTAGESNFRPWVPAELAEYILIIHPSRKDLGRELIYHHPGDWEWVVITCRFSAPVNRPSPAS